MKYIATIAFLCLAAICGIAQVPIKTGIEILKHEDARRYDPALEALMKYPAADVRERAALAAGRIGREEALPTLVSLAENDPVEKVRVMAVFAIGEVESVKGADSILKTLGNSDLAPSIKARAVEAAGKIAAANARDESAKRLGDAIVKVLEAEEDQPPSRNRETVLLALTAALRARPAGGEVVVAKYLSNADGPVRADAANTLARLRAKNANSALRGMLQKDADPIARANAARALGTAEDKESLDALINAAANDADSRVRVSAIGALTTLHDEKAADHLFNRFDTLYADFKKSRFPSPSEKSEMLVIANALARTFPAGGPARGSVLVDFVKQDKFRSTEAVNAALHVAPAQMMSLLRTIDGPVTGDPRRLRVVAQGLTEVTRLDAKLVDQAYKDGVQRQLRAFLDAPKGAGSTAIPEVLQAYAAYKPADLNAVALKFLSADDISVRAAAVGRIGALPASKENVEALKKAFDHSFAHDKHDNDLQLSLLDALVKLDKKGSVDTFLAALNSPDYLVRKKAFDILADQEIQAASPNVVSALEGARQKHKDEVQTYSAATGTKLGQMLNTDLDYRRALSRKNGGVQAVLTTEKGVFRILFTPEEAPLTVDNYVKLARSGYFNGLTVHRVVPNFVMQDGDPQGDGNGGPGWSIRCEINMLPFDRGAVGMALSGKDTGGSQWFVDHSPQPHLDGGYTVFGHVSDEDMNVVDTIVRGDKILNVKVIEGRSPQRTQRAPRSLKSK